MPTRRRFLKVAGAACASGILAQAATAADEADAPRRVFSTDREDGRFTSSPAFIHAYRAGRLNRAERNHR